MNNQVTPEQAQAWLDGIHPAYNASEWDREEFITAMAKTIVNAGEGDDRP